jgi:hypothetical protein
MSTLYTAVSRSSKLVISRDLTVLILFCLLGLTVSLAVFPRLDPEAAEFILKHLQ